MGDVTCYWNSVLKNSFLSAKGDRTMKLEACLWKRYNLLILKRNKL